MYFFDSFKFFHRLQIKILSVFAVSMKPLLYNFAKQHKSSEKHHAISNAIMDVTFL